MTKWIVLIAGIVGIYGCVANNGGGSPYTGTGAVCDVAGLSSQVTRLQDQSNSTRLALAAGLPKGGGALGWEDEQADVLRQYDVLRGRLNAFDAEIDGQYRNVTRSCNNYTRCMEANGYREGRCRSGMDRWNDAELAFSNLSRELREIDAEVAKIRIVARNCCKGGGGGKKGHKPPYINKYECDCSDSVGGVFANCCDRDSDHRYKKKRRY